MSDATMMLPAGKTCADCAHVSRCLMLGCTSRRATACDFAPSRFIEKVPAPPKRAGSYVSPLWPPPGDPRAAHHCKRGEPCRCGAKR